MQSVFVQMIQVFFTLSKMRYRKPLFFYCVIVKNVRVSVAMAHPLNSFAHFYLFGCSTNIYQAYGSMWIGGSLVGS